MKCWETRVKDWCRSLAITVAATLIVAGILGVVLYVAPNPNARRSVAIRSDERPPSSPGRAGGRRPGKASGPAQHGQDKAVVGRDGNPTNGDAPPEQISAASAGGSRRQTHDETGIGPPSETQKGSGSLAEDKKTRTVTSAGAAKPKKSPAQWSKDLILLHKAFHRKAGSPAAKRQARDKAESELEAIDDPAAVPAIWRVFVARKPDHHQLVARVLARINSADSTRGLAALSVYSEDEKARWAAANALHTRDPGDFVRPLASVFAAHLRYQPGWTEIPGQGRARVLFIEGEQVDRQYLYLSPEQPLPLSGPRGVYSLDRPYMSPQERKAAEEYNKAQAEVARNAAEAQLQSDIEKVERINQRIDEMNARAVGVLREATAAFLPPDREAWRRWLAERQGQRYVRPDEPPKTTIAQVVPPLFTPTFVPIPEPT